MATDAFKVIIVGGGPVGFFAAHCLLKANIDVVVLEAHPTIAKDIGAGVALAAPHMRVFYQLGILPDIENIVYDVSLKKNFIKNGYKTYEADFFKPTRDNFGSAANMSHRATLLQTLYDTLPDDAKAKVHTGKRVTDIQTDDQGVTVTCADKSVFFGNLVLGIDGTHSATRRIMRRLALSEDPNRDWDPDQPFVSSYRLTWCCSGPWEGRVGTTTEVQSQDSAIMSHFGKQKSWIFLYEKLEKPTMERISFTEEEAIAHAETYSDWIVDDGLKIGEFLSRVTTRGSSLIHEGDCKNWTFGRVALAGDAVHTWGPNAGRGLNNGFLDIVLLANKLFHLLNNGTKPSRLPSMSELELILREYETERVRAIKDDSGLSASVLRWQTWANYAYYIIGRYLWSCAPLLTFLANNLDAPKMRQWIVLDYIKVDKEPFVGKVSWLHPITKDEST